MARIIGFDAKVFKQFTCCNCGAVVEYSSYEEKFQYDAIGRPRTDEGTHIKGLSCPNCDDFHRTNP